MNNISKETQDILLSAGELFKKLSIDGELVIKEGTANFATVIDIEVQKFIISRIEKLIPGCNIIREETDDNRYDLKKPTWILDPVDGTINLYHGYMHSAISLALCIEGKPFVGMIYNPFTGEMFTAERGKGAFLNGKKISVSQNRELRDALISFGTSPYNRSMARDTFDVTEKLFMECQDIRRSGSAALDIAYVACGRLDGYFEMKLSPWDFAAGVIILNEAGGMATGWWGEDINMVSPGSFLATNGLIHEKVLNYLGNVKA